MESMWMVDPNDSNIIDIIHASTTCLPTVVQDQKVIQQKSKYGSGPRREYINIIVLSVVYTLAYTTFFSIQNLQSSLNQTAGLGVLSLSLMYGATLLSSYFTPVLLEGIGVKATILLTWCSLSIYTIANFYPTWETLLPTSLFFGGLVNPLWSCQASYITQRASNYANLAGKSLSKCLGKFISIFYTSFNFSIVIGNIISSMVLHRSSTLDFESDIALNTTQYHTNAGYEIEYEEIFPVIVCGANDCPLPDDISHNVTSAIAERSTVNLLLGIYCGIVVLCLLVTGFLLEPLERPTRRSPGAMIISCFCMPFRDKRLLLVLPFNIAENMFQAIVYAEFTKSYVTCALGVGMVGYVLATFGGTSAFTSYLQGYITKYTGRIPLVIGAIIIQLGVLLTLMWWYPTEDRLYLFFILAFLCGVAEGTWPSQSAAFHSLAFNDQLDQAFSNINGAKSVGFMVMFGASSFLCMSHKLMLVMAMITLGIILYTIAELLYAREKQFVDDKEKAGLTGITIEVVGDHRYVEDMLSKKFESEIEQSAEESLIAAPA